MRIARHLRAAHEIAREVGDITVWSLLECVCVKKDAAFDVLAACNFLSTAWDGKQVDASCRQTMFQGTANIASMLKGLFLLDLAIHSSTDSRD